MELCCWWLDDKYEPPAKLCKILSQNTIDHTLCKRIEKPYFHEIEFQILVQLEGAVGGVLSFLEVQFSNIRSIEAPCCFGSLYIEPVWSIRYISVIIDL